MLSTTTRPLPSSVLQISGTPSSPVTAYTAASSRSCTAMEDSNGPLSSYRCPPPSRKPSAGTMLSAVLQFHAEASTPSFWATTSNAPHFSGVIAKRTLPPCSTQSIRSSRRRPSGSKFGTNTTMVS